MWGCSPRRRLVLTTAVVGLCALVYITAPYRHAQTTKPYLAVAQSSSFGADVPLPTTKPHLDVTQYSSSFGADVPLAYQTLQAAKYTDEAGATEPTEPTLSDDRIGVAAPSIVQTASTVGLVAAQPNRVHPPNPVAVAPLEPVGPAGIPGVPNHDNLLLHERHHDDYSRAGNTHRLVEFNSGPTLSGEPLRAKLREIVVKAMGHFKACGAEHVIWSGTLLGAYRHHGIMPWDTDADFLIEHHTLQPLLTCLKDTKHDGTVWIVRTGKDSDVIPIKVRPSRV
jgi:hypothetical protein